MRIPLSTTLKNRGSTTAKDARLVNAFTEVKGGRERVVKRPSLVATFAALEAGAGNGQGLFVYSTPTGSTLVGIQNDVLTDSGSMTTIANRLAFTTQPSDWKIQTAMSPSIVVTARNSFGGTMTSFTGNVTLSFDTNPNGGTLSGTLTVAAIAGVATFSNVKIDVVGGGYKLLATSPTIFGAGRNRVSNTFKIVSNLSFTTQPASTFTNTTMASIVVKIVDSSSNAITGYVGDVTLSLAVNVVGATLSGTVTVAAVNGVATFTGLSIDVAGTFLLQATATNGGMATAYSSSFVISSATHSLVAGVFGDFLDLFGFFSGTAGSITPTTLNGNTITELYSDNSGGSFTILKVNGNVAQSFFTSVTANSVTLTSASATFSTGGGTTSWTWNSQIMFSAATTYPVAIV